jgi:hypothetical protein
MTTFDQLDALSSRELHDRAVRRARRHLDVRFMWRLLEAAPAVDAAQGDLAQAESDVMHWSGQVGDALRDDEVSLDARRALYIDYLLEHGDG